MPEPISTQKQVELNRQRVALKPIIDTELDGLYNEASKLGQLMGRLFGATGRSQLRNLETVVSAATRTSALKNHIKNQTGKDRGVSWALKPKGCDLSLGTQVLQFVEQLGSRAKAIVERAQMAGTPEHKADLAREVEIELQRGVVQTAVCTALYAGVGEE